MQTQQCVFHFQKYYAKQERSVYLASDVAIIMQRVTEQLAQYKLHNLSLVQIVNFQCFIF
jgi:hypothetical protein